MTLGTNLPRTYDESNRVYLFDSCAFELRNMFHYFDIAHESGKIDVIKKQINISNDTMDKFRKFEGKAIILTIPEVVRERREFEASLSSFIERISGYCNARGSKKEKDEIGFEIKTNRDLCRNLAHITKGYKKEVKGFNDFVEENLLFYEGDLEDQPRGVYNQALNELERTFTYNRDSIGTRLRTDIKLISLAFALAVNQPVTLVSRDRQIGQALIGMVKGRKVYMNGDVPQIKHPLRIVPGYQELFDKCLIAEHSF